MRRRTSRPAAQRSSAGRERGQARTGGTFTPRRLTASRPIYSPWVSPCNLLITTTSVLLRNIEGLNKAKLTLSHWHDYKQADDGARLAGTRCKLSFSSKTHKLTVTWNLSRDKSAAHPASLETARGGSRPTGKSTRALYVHFIRRSASCYFTALDPPVKPGNIHSQHRRRIHFVACTKAYITDDDTNIVGAGASWIGDMVKRKEGNRRNEQTESFGPCVQVAFSVRALHTIGLLIRFLFS